MTEGRADLRLGALLALLVLALNAFWVSQRYGFVHKPRRVLETDHLHYIEMAKGAEGKAELARTPPYAFRVLTPWLARQLAQTGLGLNGAFYAITNASLFGFLLVTWLILRDLGYDARTRAVGLLVFGFTQGPIRWFEYQYWMSDPPCLFLLALGLYLLRREHFLALAAVSAAAAFLRETYIVLYPCLLVAEWVRRGWRPAVVRTIAVAALPLAILIWLHTTIPTDRVDDPIGGIVDSLGFRWRHLGNNQLYVLTVGTWGVALPLALLFPGRLREGARRNPELAMLIPCVYATLVISNNTERPLAYAMPAMLAAALYGFDRWIREARLPFWPAAALVVALQAYLWLVTRFNGLGISMYQPGRWDVPALMLAFWMAARLLLRSRAAHVAEPG